MTRTNQVLWSLHSKPEGVRRISKNLYLILSKHTQTRSGQGLKLVVPSDRYARECYTINLDVAIFTSGVEGTKWSVRTQIPVIVHSLRSGLAP